LVKRLRRLLADITFLEAYERTNRFLNVTVTAADTNEPPRMLNYMTAPHVVIWSAVACSSAFPGLFPAQELLARDADGKFVKCAALLTTSHPAPSARPPPQQCAAHICAFAATCAQAVPPALA
jgi:TAG lipase / steryl ester hydrolase / phospholipase A2 / LPA acyltransferase